MGKDVKKRFTVSLDIDTKDAEKQIKSTVGNLKTILADLGNASDKMSYFKELVDYVQQIDTALTAFKNKNKDAFNNMFDGLDSNLKQVMENIFETSLKSVSALNELRNKINSAAENGAGVKELRSIAEDINDLFINANKLPPIDIEDKFTGRGNAKERINMLKEALDNFTTVWDGVNNKIKNGFSFGRSGGGGGNPITKLTDSAQKQVDVLEEKIRNLQSLIVGLNKSFSNIKAFNDGDDMELNFDATEESANNLLNTINQLSFIKQKYDAGQITTEEDYQNLIKYVQAAEQLVAVYTEMQNQGMSSKALRERFSDSGVEDFISDINKNFVNNISNSLNKILTDAKNRIAAIKADDNNYIKSETLKDDIIKDDNKIAVSYDELKKKVQEYYDILQKRNKISDINSDEYKRLTEQLNDISLSIEKIKTLDKTGLGDLRDVFGDLEYGEINSVEEALNRICDIFKIEIPQSVETSNESIKNLTNSLEQALSDGTRHEVEVSNGTVKPQENMQLVGNNGVVSITTGDDFKISSDEMVSQLLANLKENIIMSLHNHPNSMDAFTPDDVKAFAELYYGQGTKINGIIGNGKIKTIDFSGISQEMAIRVANSFQEELIKASEKFKDVFTYDGKNLQLTEKIKALETTNPLQFNDIIDGIYGEIDKALERSFQNNGLESTVKTYTKDQLPELAQYLSEIQKNGQNAIDPIEKLKNLITTLRPDQTFDWNQFTDIFEKFKSGAIDGSQALNQILDFKTVAADAEIVTTSINQAESKVKEFLALADEIHNKSFDDSWDATDNVEIGKYTERLNAAKAALDALGDQGQLTAEQLEQVNNAFNQATGDLSSRTKTYDAYASGSSSTYDYYDEYERERDKADQLEQENESLREQLSKKQQTTEEYTNAENASLERKLELLSDIADQYANNITQRDRNRYEQLNYKDAESGLTSKEEDRYFELGEKIDEADEQLQQFGETYDKILLKLANGKTIEILPDDAGLRKLDKIANEFYQGEYDGIEIEDVVFMRKQEQAVIEQNNQELERQLDIQEQLDQRRQNTLYETPDGQLSFFENMSDSAQRAEKDVAGVVEEVKKLDTLDGQLSFDDILGGNKGQSSETSQLNALQEKLVKVKSAVEQKTKAFKDEVTAVGTGVDTELVALNQLLEALIKIIEQINLIKEGFASINGEVAELNTAQDTNVNRNIPAEVTNEKAKEVISQDYALDSTLVKTNGLLNNILTAIGNNESIKGLVDPLTSVVTELKSVANGIIKHQKAQKTDLSDASFRIANNYNELVSQVNAATAKLGSNMQIKPMKPLADGIVQVEGAVKDANGVWNGFIADINESNQVIFKAVGTQTNFAKSLNEAAEAAKKEKENITKTEDNQFTKSLNNQITSFDKYREKLKDVSYISDDLKTKLDELGTKLRQVTDTTGLNNWKDSFSEVEKQITLAEKTFIAQQTGKVNQAQKVLDDSFKKTGLKETDTNVTDEQQKIIDGYKQAKAVLRGYNTLAQQGNQIEASTLQNVTSELYKQIEAYKQRNNIVDGSKATYGTKAVASAKYKYESLKRVVKEEFNDSVVVQKALNQYTTAYENLIDKQKKYKVGQKLDANQEVEFKQLQTACNDYAKELNKLITASKKFAESADNVTPVDEDFEDSIQGRQKALQDYVQVQYGASAKIGEFDSKFEKLTFTIDNGNGTFTQMTAAINPARNAIGAITGDTEKATTAFRQFINEVKGKFKTISAYLISSFSLQEIWQQLRQGIGYVKEIDSALTELKKVTDETDATYKNFLQTASKTASAIGSTVADFTNATADFARLGYDLEQASSLAEAASVYKNVGDDIEDVSQASESIISTMKAFGIEAENAMGIVDRFNEVGNNFAISSTGIGEAMQRSASALYEAGNTIDESIALITGANSVIQNPEQVGEMLADYKVA